MMLNNESLGEFIFEELGVKYPNGMKDGVKLKFDAELIKEILDIQDNIEKVQIDYDQMSSTALEQFQQPFMQWVQRGDDSYFPIEQVIRDLKELGWIIKPPEGV